MTINILSIVLSFIFLTLGIIHFYWVLGGEWGLKSAIPTKVENEDSDFRPSVFATLLVCIILIAFAYFYLTQTGFIAIQLPKWTNPLLWILPIIFLLRAIGEFKYIGFFKSIKTTTFAKWDSKLFSPLCLFIGLVGITIQLIK